jgi:hypothetical protein
VRLFVFLQFDYYDFDWLVSGIDVGVHGVGRVGGEPVGFTCFPDVGFFGTALIDDIHGAALKRDDDAPMIMPVHGEWRVGEDQGAPDFDFVILNQLGSLSLGLGTNGGEECQGERGHCHCAVQRNFHRNPPVWRKCSSYSELSDGLWRRASVSNNWRHNRNV